VDLRDFFDSAADGVLVVDDRDRVIYWNGSATEILGFESGEAVGRYCYDVLKGLGERGTVICGPECTLKACAFRGEKIHNFNMLTAHKDGRKIRLNMSTMCARDFEGTDTVVVHMFRDVERMERTNGQTSGPQVITIGVQPSLRPGGQAVEPLTVREEEVLALLGDGHTSKQIADRLTISEATARNHIQNILGKLGVHSRLEAALWARERRQT
jgi:PAS domain S-box-containing protein